MKWLVLCGMLVLVQVATPNVIRLDDDVDNAVARIKRQIQDGSCSMADLVFVLDSSGSMTSENWQKVLNFTVGIVNGIGIGQYDSHVGVVYYGSMAYLGFHLNQHENRADLIDAIMDLDWKDEETNTSGGIWYMRQNMFKLDRGDRASAPNIGIVVTDGESNRDQGLTIPYANEAKAAGITMIAVGVGMNQTNDELVGIATNTSYVFSVDNFLALQAIQAQIISAACDVPVTCTGNPDVVFVLDASGSVREKYFDVMKEFVNTIVDTVNVDTDYATKIGLMTYSDSAHVIFDLNKFRTRYDIKQAVTAARYWRGTTNTAEALRKLRTDMFVTNKGDRSTRPNIAILFTDGGSNDYDQTLSEAMKAREAGIKIIVVAVSDWVNENEVMEMASDPDDNSVFRVPNFNEIRSIEDGITEVICNALNECSSNPCGNGGTCEEGINKFKCICTEGFAGVRCNIACRQPADVVLAVDTSGSLGKTNFYKVQDFTKDIVSNLNIDGLSRSHVGLETFADGVSVKFHLNAYTTDEAIRSAMSYPYKGGSTNTAQALQTMRESMFTSNNGDRSGYRNVGVVITDGESNDRARTFREAVSNRNKGIEMISVGIGLKSIMGQREIRGIANDPDDKNVINVDNVDGLSDIIPGLIESICNTVDECDGVECQGGGTCVDVMNGYRCECPTGRTGVNCERLCDGQADIVIGIDASGSIRLNRFTMVLDYVRNVVKALEVAEDRARVGVIVFSDSATVKFHMNTYKTKEDILQAIETIDYIRGKTNIADVLMKMRTEMFTAANGDREDVPNYAILITDGESTVNKERTLPEAVETRIAGVILTVVVVGYKEATLEIKGIASDPDERHVMAVENYDGLTSLIEKTIGDTCDATDECSSNPCQNGGRCINMHGQFYCLCQNEYTGVTCQRRCRGRSDVVIVLDASGSVEASYALAQDMARRLVNGLNFDGGRTRVGVATYSDSATAKFHLNTYTDKTSVLNAISYTLENGKTNTASGIDMARNEMFTSSRGDRNGDQNYAIVITDGKSNINRGGTIPAANSARQAGIKMIAIGIGNNGNVDRSEINGIANDPDNQFAFLLDDASSLDEVANNVLDQICQ